MTFLTPTELRHTLKISHSTEHRLLKSGMPSIGGGRLRRRIPYVKVGRLLGFNSQLIDDWLQATTVMPMPERRS